MKTKAWIISTIAGISFIIAGTLNLINKNSVSGILDMVAGVLFIVASVTSKKTAKK